MNNIYLTDQELTDLFLALQSRILKLSKSNHSAAAQQLARMEALQDKIEDHKHPLESLVKSFSE